MKDAVINEDTKVVDKDNYFNEKLNRLSVRDYSNLMLEVYQMKTGGWIEFREFDKKIDKLLNKGNK
jgi:hypothetical protein